MVLALCLVLVFFGNVLLLDLFLIIVETYFSTDRLQRLFCHTCNFDDDEFVMFVIIIVGPLTAVPTPFVP